MTYFMGSDDEVGCGAEFGWFGSHIGHFVSNAVKVAGKPIGAALHVAQDATGAVTGAIGKIPVVGAPIHGIMSATYHATVAPMANAANAAYHGKRLDRVALGALKDQVKGVKEVGPYAQTVLSVVPGVGTGVGAALGAGLALADGQPIDKALMAGVISALPGGPAAQAAAHAAAAAVQAAARGEKFDLNSVSGALMNSLPVSPAVKEALTAGAHVVGNVAQGKNVAGAISEETLKKAMSAMPPEIRKAYQTGLALGSATVAQAHRALEIASPALLNKLVESGIQASKAVPAIAEARKLAGSGTAVRGFDLAQGLLNQHSNAFDIVHARSLITNPDELKAFDVGLATKIGLVAHPPRGKLSAAAQAGHAIALGVQGMPHPENQKSILATVARHPSAAVGAKVAAKQVAVQNSPWYIKILHALGLK